MLPALIRFNGEPFVDDDGHLLYKFPDLQVRGLGGMGVLLGFVQCACVQCACVSVCSVHV